MDAKKLKEIEKEVKELFSMMGVSVTPEVSYDKKNESINVNIDAGEETGLLIGNRGETVNSLQSAIGMILKQKYGEWIRVSMNVGDWRQKTEERLTSLADQTKERAIQTGKPQPLYNLSPGERRIIHMYFSEDKEVETLSEGEGTSRYLVVKPK